MNVDLNAIIVRSLDKHLFQKRLIDQVSFLLIAI